MVQSAIFFTEHAAASILLCHKEILELHRRWGMLDEGKGGGRGRIVQFPHTILQGSAVATL